MQRSAIIIPPSFLWLIAKTLPFHPCNGLYANQAPHMGIPNHNHSLQLIRFRAIHDVDTDGRQDFIHSSYIRVGKGNRSLRGGSGRGRWLIVGSAHTNLLRHVHQIHHFIGVGSARDHRIWANPRGICLLNLLQRGHGQRINAVGSVELRKRGGDTGSVTWNERRESGASYCATPWPGHWTSVQRKRVWVPHLCLVLGNRFWGQVLLSVLVETYFLLYMDDWVTFNKVAAVNQELCKEELEVERMELAAGAASERAWANVAI